MGSGVFIMPPTEGNVWTLIFPHLASGIAIKTLLTMMIRPLFTCYVN